MLKGTGKILRQALICAFTLVLLSLPWQAAVAQQTTDSNVLTDREYNLWLSYLERIQTATFSEYLPEVIQNSGGVHISSVLSATSLELDDTSDRWKLERVIARPDPRTGVSVSGGQVTFKFRHKQSGHYLTFSGSTLTLSDRSSISTLDSDAQWVLIPAKITAMSVEISGDGGYLETLELPAIHIRHASTGKYIHLQNGSLQVSSSPGNAWMILSEVMSSINYGARENSSQPVVTNSAAVLPDLSKVWSSTYGDMHWNAGWYDETNNLMSISEPVWNHSYQAYVVTGTWGRRDGVQNAGGVEFIYTASCVFAGSWWYSATPDQKNPWNGRCK